MYCDKHDGACEKITVVGGAHNCDETFVETTGAPVHKCLACGKKWELRKHPGEFEGWILL